MEKRVIASIAVAMVIAAGTAHAADLSNVYKAPVMAPASTWTGLYGGLSLGGRWADPSWTTTSVADFSAGALIPPPGPDQSSAGASFDSSTFRVGGYLGYNWQIAPTWVAGVEADLAWGNSSKTIAGIPGTYGPAVAVFGLGPSLVPGGDTTTVKETWDGSLRGRIGFLATPTLLLFGTGGVSWIHIETGASCATYPAGPWCLAGKSETASATKPGWTIGGGLEQMFAGKWLARFEYRYADYESFNHTFFAGTADQFAMNQSLKTHTVLLGLGYKF